MTATCPHCAGPLLDGVVYVRVEAVGRSTYHGLPARVCVRCDYRESLTTTMPVPDLSRASQRNYGALA